MKLLLAVSALAGMASANTIDDAVPVQTFFVPLPEYEVFTHGFKPTNSVAKGPVTSIVAFSISTDDTVVWYDHWEDGYDADVVNGASASTQIWGDKNITNGCAFGMPCTSDADDVLVAGQSIVIENKVPLDHHTAKASNLYDARDKIMSSFHIAVTRGSYPETPGSYMAGAVEVHDTNSWGTRFEAPFGKTLNTNSDASRGDAYERSLVFVQAGEDGTRVFAKGVWTDLNAGESHFIDADQGDIIETNKKVQADIVTSDLNSGYELRWYSLLANEYWSNKYLTPMGDSTSKTRVVIYNPESNKLTVTVTTPSKTYNVEIPGKSSSNTEPIETGDGAILESVSGKNFMAMSQTDTLSSGANNDWGFPLVPYDQLSSQVLISWGYGCKGQTCSGTNRKGDAGSRSVVYVSCVAACDIYVDTDNDGTSDLLFNNTPAISSTSIVDPTDHDMSGAIIWATEPGQGPKGAVIQIASAWGQDPSRSWGGDQEAMDLGTTVLPFATVKVSETVELFDDKDGNGVISAGDVLKYTIRIQNSGQVDIFPNQLTIKGPTTPEQLTQRQYDLGSCQYDNMLGQKQQCADGSLGITGLKNPYKLPKRSGSHDITFTATINDIDQIHRDVLPQGGLLYRGNYAPLPFSVDSKILFDADIKLIKTIHHGDVTCSVATQGLGPDDAKLIQGAPGAPSTYCYRVINTGDSYLKLQTLSDPDIGLLSTIPSTVLAPNTQHIVKVPRTLGITPLNGTATIDANPSYYTGNPLPDMPDVTDTDYAGFKILYPDADVQIDKTVHLGHWSSCTVGVDLVTGYDADNVTYCYMVTNKGGTHLKDFALADPHTGFTSNGAVPMLAPGASHMLPGHKSTITKTIFADAQVTAFPAHSTGASIAGMTPVTDVDPAGVRMIAKQVLPVCPPGGGSDWVAPGPLGTVPVTAMPQVAAPQAFSIIKPDFSTSAVADAFEFRQNTFRGTTMGLNMARSSYDSGNDALKLKLGHYCSDNSKCSGSGKGMSGGYSTKFRLVHAGKVKVNFRVKGYNSATNEKNEDGYGYVSLNDSIIGDAFYYLDGNKTDNQQGWKDVSMTIDAQAGDNEIIIGSYFTYRTYHDEHVTFLFKNIDISYEP